MVEIQSPDIAVRSSKLRTSGAENSQTFNRFASGLGETSEFFGDFGNFVVAPISAAANIYEWRQGEIGLGRLTFRSVAAGGGIAVGVTVGAVPAVTVGGVAWMTEKSYDGFMWWFDKMSQAMAQTEEALNNGWVPGR